MPVPNATAFNSVLAGIVAAVLIFLLAPYLGLSPFAAARRYEGAAQPAPAVRDLRREPATEAAPQKQEEERRPAAVESRRPPTSNSLSEIEQLLK